MDVTACRAAPPVYIHAAGGVVAAAAGVVDSSGFGDAPMRGDAQPVPLRAEVARDAPLVSRMASRLSQLAVLGAADCLRGLKGELDPDTRIYLATGLGDVAHTDALYYDVMPPRSEMPSPARFATSGNNMAAFFVAQHAGLASRNLTLSREELSLEGALELALSDFAAGATRSALIGGVDETTLPREFYTRRFHVGPDQAIGEGSGWLLLDAAPARGGVPALGAVLGAWIVPAPGVQGPEGLIDQALRTGKFLAQEAPHASRIALLPGTGIAANELSALHALAQGSGPIGACHAYLDWSGRFPTAAAVGIVAMFGARPGQDREELTCLHVNRDARGNAGLIAFSVNRSSQRSPHLSRQ